MFLLLAVGISACLEQKDSYVAYLWPRSSTFQAAACAWLVFLVTILLAVFPSVVDMLKMLGILVRLDQKDSSQRYSWFLLGHCFWKMFRILRNAWFDNGFTLLRQFSELLKELTLSTCRWTLVFQRNAWCRSGRDVSVGRQRQVRTVLLCIRQLPWLVSSGQLRVSFWGPAHRCRAKGVMSTGISLPELDASVWRYRQRSRSLHSQGSGRVSRRSLSRGVGPLR